MHTSSSVLILVLLLVSFTSVMFHVGYLNSLDSFVSSCFYQYMYVLLY